MADNIVLNNNTSTGATLATDDDGTAHHQYVKLEFGADNTQTKVSTTNPLPINAYAGGTALTVGGGVEAGALLVTIASNSTGTLSVDDGAGSLTVDGTVAATQSGAWNVGDITGTVSLPTGAATEASLVKLPLAQGSTTSGQSGPLTQGAVTTSAPTYTTGQTSPLSLTTGGLLRVAIGGTTSGIFTPVDLQRVGGGTVAVGIGADSATTQRVAITSDQFPAAATAGDGTGSAALSASRIHSFLHSYEPVGGTWDMTRIFDIDSAQGGLGVGQTKGPLAVAIRRDADTSIVDLDGDFAPLLVDDIGALKVNVVAGGGSGGTSSTDDAAFTAGTGSGTPIMGFATSDVVDAGDVGVLAMDTSRNLKVSIEVDNAGIGGGTQYAVDDPLGLTPTGTLAVAIRDDALSALTPVEGDAIGLRVDANGALWVIPSGTVTVDGSGVTQPISAASLPLPTNAATDGPEGTDAAAHGASQTVLRVAGTDGTNDQQIAVDATGNVQVDIVADAAGLATAANQLPDGHNVTIDNAAGAAAVNIQDGGNSITVDGTVAVSSLSGSVDTELTTDDLDTGAGTDTRAVVGLVGSASGGGQLIPGSATDGLLVNLGANNDITGTVTANAGTNLNTSALALETGGNLATIAGDTTSLDGKITACDTGAVTVSSLPGTAAEAAALPSVLVVVAGDDGTGTPTHPLQVDPGSGDLKITLDSEAVVLGAGSASIGTLGANSGVDIGDVTVNNGTGASAVNVQDGGNSLTIDNATLSVTGTGTATGALRVAFATGSSTIATGEVAHDAAVSGNPLVAAGTAQDNDDTAPPNRTSAEGDVTRLATSRDGAVHVLPHGPQIWHFNANPSTAQTDQTVHAAPGAGLSLYVTDIFVGCNGAVTVTIEEGTTTQKWRYYAADTGDGASVTFRTPIKITANTALTYTTSAAVDVALTVCGYTAP